jgi:hypothetical protein
VVFKPQPDPAPDEEQADVDDKDQGFFEATPEPPCEECNEVLANLETAITHLQDFIPTRHEYDLIKAKIGELTGVFQTVLEHVELREQRASEV